MPHFLNFCLEAMNVCPQDFSNLHHAIANTTSRGARSWCTRDAQGHAFLLSMLLITGQHLSGVRQKRF